MRASTGPTLLGAFLTAITVNAQLEPALLDARDVDTRFPYKGPAIPIGDWVDQTVNGNGKGFPRLVEAPAVKPAKKNPTNNINVISLTYLPHGVNVHFQTPYGLGSSPSIHWGTAENDLCEKSTGKTVTYVGETTLHVY